MYIYILIDGKMPIFRATKSVLQAHLGLKDESPSIRSCGGVILD